MKFNDDVHRQTEKTLDIDCAFRQGVSFFQSQYVEHFSRETKPRPTLRIQMCPERLRFHSAADRAEAPPAAARKEKSFTWQLLTASSNTVERQRSIVPDASGYLWFRGTLQNVNRKMTHLPTPRPLRTNKNTKLVNILRKYL